MLTTGLALDIVHLSYDCNLPYLQPVESTRIGYACIIDKERGYLLTTSSLASSTRSISGRSGLFGRRVFPLRLNSLIPEKNLAILQCAPEDLKMLQSHQQCPTSQSMFSWDRGDEFIGVGLIDGNISVERGICIGPNETTTVEDSHSRPCFKVILSGTRLSEGSSIHSSTGDLVGIKNRDDSMIPYSTIRAHLPQLYSSTLTVSIPSFDLLWSSCSREMIETYTSSSSLNGIRVRGVNKKSILPDLTEGDLITHLTYIDHEACLTCCFFDRYGEVIVCNVPTTSPHSNSRAVIEAKPSSTDVYVSSNKRPLAEVVDSIPIGSEITLQICRDRSWYRLHSQNLPRTSEINSLPHYIPIDYELFCGLCIVEKGGKLTIGCIFPTSILRSLVIDNIAVGDILTNVDGVEVGTLDTLREVNSVKVNPRRITFKVSSTEFVFSRFNSASGDSDVARLYCIDKLHTSLLNSMTEKVTPI